jgi:hypothetical protein
MNQYNQNMGLYGPPPSMPMGASQFTARTDQPQPQPVSAPDFFSQTADMSPSSLPVQSIEGASALDMGSQPSLRQPFDLHTLRSIPEGNRTAPFHPGAVMQSFMAATAGASYMQNPSHDTGLQYDAHGLPHSYSNDLTFSVPHTLPNEPALAHEPFNGFADFTDLGYSSLSSINTSSSADVQHSTGSLSSEASPFSGTESIETTLSSSGPNASSVTSIASVYSGWTDEHTIKPELSTDDDAFDTPYSMPQASSSEHTLAVWNPHARSQPFGQAGMYQHANASAHAVLQSPGQLADRKLNSTHSEFDGPSAFGDDFFSRRNSSATSLATNIEAIHIRTPEGFKQPSQPSSIAARRQKRPIALNSSTLRSTSYNSGMPSPGGSNEHTLRRIRSSGIGAASGRIQKPSPGSAQRSPMTMTFADAAASPKFARAFTSPNATTVGQGGSLAPPTPLTPHELGRFPYWQANTAIRSHVPMPEHNSPESLNANWSVEPQSAGLHSSAASPPSPSLDLSQLNQGRLAHDGLYRDTPPQSAPATQQSFLHTGYLQRAQMRSGFHSSSDLTIAQPKPSHFRRPSLPDAGHGNPEDGSMDFSMQFDDMHYDDKFGDMSFEGINHQHVPFAPPPLMPEFFAHEYAHPQGPGSIPLFRRTTEPQPRNYIFANQGPGDFKN